jgi:hypothetical protein
MGMKTAACWFSNKWMVTSTSLGENVERTIKFDIPKIVSQGLERLEPTVKRAKENDHSTEIVLWELNNTPVKRTVGKIRDYLAQMYRRFLASGQVRIFWNDEELSYPQRAVLVAPFHGDGQGGQKHRWEKEFELNLPKGEVVRGRAMLFDRGEQAAAGLHLFWRERLIKGSLEDRYRPQEIFGQGNSYRQQRLLVELDMDMFSPTVDKTDLVWGGNNSTEAELLAALKRELDRRPLRLLDQAENYRSTKVDRSTRKAAEAAVHETIDVIREHGAEELAEQVGRSLPKQDLLPTPGAARAASETVLDLKVDGQSWRIAIELSDRDADRSRLLEITEKVSTQANGIRRLGIRISLNNPFAVRFATDGRSVNLLIRALAGLALAEVSARDAGAKNAGEIRRNFNDLITNVLAQS